MEIYNETVTDLLVDSWKRKPLEVRETINVSELFISVTSVFLIKSLQVYIPIFNKQNMQSNMSRLSSGEISVVI